LVYFHRLIHRPEEKSQTYTHLQQISGAIGLQHLSAQRKWWRGSEAHVIFLKVVAWWFGANMLLFGALCALAMRKESQADKTREYESAGPSPRVEQWQKQEPARKHAYGVAITNTFTSRKSRERRLLSHARD
jgi:hypothetical protein